jgi:hypothetical protein
MANDDKAKAHAPARRTERDQDAADDSAAGRPLPAPRKLTSRELEALRLRLQRKFH